MHPCMLAEAYRLKYVTIPGMAPLLQTVSSMLTADWWVSKQCEHACILELGI